MFVLGELKQTLSERADFQPQEHMQHHRQQSQAGEQSMPMDLRLGRRGGKHQPWLGWADAGNHRFVPRELLTTWQ